MKKSLRLLIPLVLVVLAVFIWRYTHSALSDEDQIRQSLDGLATQASNKNAGGITSFLSEDFQLDGLKKKDLRQQLTIGMLNYRVVRMQINSTKIQVNGDTATSTGRYDLGLKSEYTSPEDKYSSEFHLKWKRENNQWKISNADGNKLPLGLSGSG